MIWAKDKKEEMNVRKGKKVKDLMTGDKDETVRQSKHFKPTFMGVSLRKDGKFKRELVETMPGDLSSEENRR